MVFSKFKETMNIQYFIINAVYIYSVFYSVYLNAFNILQHYFIHSFKCNPFLQLVTI